MPEFDIETNLEGERDFNELLARLRQIVVRRRWWILIPFCVVTFATISVLGLLPNRYTSEATLLVVQQQVPQRYVVPNSTTDIAVALEAMKREVLSRSRLQKITVDFDLYAKKRRRLAPEELIALMLRDIDIAPLSGSPQQKDFNAFRIAFTTENPLVAQQVTDTLTSLFIQENLKTRAVQATNTTSFLHEQLENAKTRLAEQEQRIREFKMQHLGELPEQQQGNLGILNSLQTQLQNTMASMARAQEQRVYLESLLGGYQAWASGNTTLPGTPDLNRKLTPFEAAQNDVVRLRSERATLLGTLTRQHPDVIKVERQLVPAEALLERLRPTGSNPEPTDTPTATATENLASPPDQPAVAQIRSQLESNRVEMANLSKDEANLKASLSHYQSRLNLTPVREQELTGILRDYDFRKQDYTDLQNKAMQSELATNLEKNQGGEQFRLVDPPSLPAIPSSPRRLLINLGGAAVGLFLGIAMAFLIETRDQSYHSEAELRHQFGPHLVLGIPLLLTSTEVRARTWRTTAQWLVGSALTLAVCVAELYIFRQH